MKYIGMLRSSWREGVLSSFLVAMLWMWGGGKESYAENAKTGKDAKKLLSGKRLPTEVDQGKIFAALLDLRQRKETNPDVYTISLSNLDPSKARIYYVTVGGYDMLKKTGEHNNPEKWTLLFGKKVELKYGNYYFWIMSEYDTEHLRGKVVINKNQEIEIGKAVSRPKNNDS